jgi:hypothetical protein
VMVEKEFAVREDLHYYFDRIEKIEKNWFE